MEELLRQHWYDLGGILSILTAIYLFVQYHLLTNYQILMWINLITLFLHQLEEYRIVGTFPGMLNKTLFESDLPDRYPLNTQISVYVNVYFAWTIYCMILIKF